MASKSEDKSKTAAAFSSAPTMAMPLLMLGTLRTRLAWCFYHYGKTLAKRPLLVLTLAMTVVTFFSYPVVSSSFFALSLGPLMSLDTLDAHEWLFSPHLSLTHDIQTPTPALVVQQIRVMNPEQCVTQDLFKSVRLLYQTLVTSRVIESGKPVSLQSICVLRHNQCIIHSPLDYWENDTSMCADFDWIATVNRRMHLIGPHNDLSLHPLALFGNVSLDDQGLFLAADSIFLNVLIEEGSSSARVWEAVWKKVQQQLHIIDLSDGLDLFANTATACQKKLNLRPKVYRYKFKIFPDKVWPELYSGTVAYVSVFFLVMQAFRNQPQVKSCVGLGAAALFVALASYTTTMGLLSRLGVFIQLKLWYLAPLVTISATLENVFLLTNAVLSARRDMPIHEKIGLGLKTVCEPILLALCGELIILTIGSTTNIHGVFYFCRFAAVMLLIEFFLQFTFFSVILSIDIKRTELSDMAGVKPQQSDARSSMSAKAAQNAQYNSTSLASQKRRLGVPSLLQPHPALNALMLCFIILSLGLYQGYAEQQPIVEPVYENGALFAMSNRFWQTTNPNHRDRYLLLPPPYLVVFSKTLTSCEALSHQFEAYYAIKEAELQSKKLNGRDDDRDTSTKARLLFEDSIQRLFLFTIGVKTPMWLLLFVFGGIITWMSPRGRERWLRPILKKVCIKVAVSLLRIVVKVPRWRAVPRLQRILRNRDNYNTEGVHHGAISAQREFNEQRIRSYVANVKIITLSGKHTSDISYLDMNGKNGSIISCGQDGRLVLWDVHHGDWKACLDTMEPIKIKGIDIESIPHPRFRRGNAQTATPLSTLARCVKVDKGSKWVAAGFDDGSVRIWRTASKRLIREFFVCGDEQVAMEEGSVNSTSTEPLPMHHGQDPSGRLRPQRPASSRVIALEFVGTLLEDRSRKTKEDTSERKSGWQNLVISIHKDGVMREWNITAGTCQSAFHVGHASDMTGLCVLERKLADEKGSVTWVITAAKDGTIQCCRRKCNTDKASTCPRSRVWVNLYRIQGHRNSVITVLAAEQSSISNDIGVLVTGSSDGSVRLWNLETGEAIFTLSKGITESSSTINEEDTTGQHRGAVTQVVLASYDHKEMEPKPKETCMDNGFFVASCSADDTVHVWRFAWADPSVPVGSCTRCAKGHHRRLYKRSQQGFLDRENEGVGASDRSLSQRRSSLDQGEVVHSMGRRSGNVFSPSVPGERVDHDRTGVWIAMYLGKINQVAGRRLTFCDGTILAGVRLAEGRTTKTLGVPEKWEVWFAVMHYYEPEEDDRVEGGDRTIPVQTFDLSQTTTGSVYSSQTMSNGWIRWLRHLWLFRNPPNVHTHSMEFYQRLTREDDTESEKDNEDADFLLPFSSVRNIVPLDGFGLGCDYGNFIKLVLFQDKL